MGASEQVCKDAGQLKESTHQRSQEIAMASVSNANHLNTFLLARGREGRERERSGERGKGEDEMWGEGGLEGRGREGESQGRDGREGEG